MAHLRAQGGRTLRAAYVNSAEVGPQISLYAPALAVAAPPAATTVTVTLTPLAPTQPLPSDGAIVTNVYRVEASAPDGAATFRRATRTATPVVQMRAPTGKQPGPVFEHRVGTRWVRSPTKRVGYDVYQTYLTAPGDWALVRLSSNPHGGGNGVGVPLIAGGVGLLVAVAILMLVRAQRRRRAPQ